MKTMRITLPMFLALLLALAPGLALAQNLGQQFAWPELGFSMAYPAGWVEIALDDQTAILSSDPNIDLQSDSMPTEPAVIIAGLPAEMAAMMGEPADIMQLFTGQFGADGGSASETSFAGLSALRMTTDSSADNISLDVVLLTGESYYYLVLAITPLGGGADFAPTFEAMLNTVSLSTPVVAATPAAVQLPSSSVLINGVRITFDQTITGSWNEIDAVELVGTDESGAVVQQWASQAEATSEYGTDSWAAAQATGAPDTAECGDFGTAWASATTSSDESLTLLYDTPVAASAVNIYETYNPGAIISVELLTDGGGTPITLFADTDSTTPCPGVLTLPVDPSLLNPTLIQTVPPGTTLINGVRVSLDQSIIGTWNEIDAVELVGATEAGDSLSQWAASAEATSEYGEEGWSAIQATGEPDTPECGDFTTAWASASSTGVDSLTLTYATPVMASQVNIHETYNPGSITLVELLPADGSAPIAVFSGVDNGTACPGVFSIDVTATGDMLSYGQTVSGVITDTAYSQEWRFAGAAGDGVTITMAADEPDGTLDPYLSLYDSSGRELTANDDSNSADLGLYDAQIAGFVLPGDGQYVVIASRFNEELGTGTGTYTLTLERGDSTVPVGSLSYGASVSGTISDSTPYQDWTFEGTAGDSVIITQRAADGSALDSYLSLYDPAGALAAENDDSNDPELGDLDSQITDFVLPATGTYRVRASRFDDVSGTTTGAYELSLSRGG